ncbi:MAG: dockerin type I repeat-containing protein [Oscillospiraceae bacterium]|nr:dockerin type I repeat-containing protein [Oscillospiraceae bacterium]
MSDWEGTTLTEWGEIFFNGTNGVKDSSDLCTVYTASTPDTPSDVVYGDVNCDGQVSIADVLTLNKNLMCGEKLSDEGAANADVDGDGAPSSADALNILKFVVKILDKLPV